MESEQLQPLYFSERLNNTPPRFALPYSLCSTSKRCLQRAEEALCLSMGCHLHRSWWGRGGCSALYRSHKAGWSVCPHVLRCGWFLPSSAQQKALRGVPERPHSPDTQRGAENQRQVRTHAHVALASSQRNTFPEGCFWNLSSDWSHDWSRALPSQQPPQLKLLVDVLGVHRLLCGITISHSSRLFLVTQKPWSLLLAAPPP